MVCGVALRAREALYTKRPRVSSATVLFGPRFSWGGTLNVYVSHCLNS